MGAPLKLTVFQGGEQIAEHSFERDIIKIGRLASAHLKLDDQKVSRIHSVIESTGETYSIIDMGSTEGTFLNGEKISKETLRDGDEITLGDFRVLVSFQDVVDEAAGGGRVASQDLGDAEPWSQTQDFEEDVGTVVSANQAFESAQNGVAVGVEETELSEPVAASATEDGAGTARPSHREIQDRTRLPAKNAWGVVVNNIATDEVPESDRVLEVRTLWGNTVLDTVTASDKPTVTMGDERKVAGWGPFQKILRCDIEVPSKGFQYATFPLAESLGGEGAQYTINLAESFGGRLERLDGKTVELESLPGLEAGDLPDTKRYTLMPSETLSIEHGRVSLQIRYVQKQRVPLIPFFETLNYTWLNVLILAFFLHLVAIASFIATPMTEADLVEDLFKNRNRFAQFRLTEEQRKRARAAGNNLLRRLKAEGGFKKAKGTEGKAGRKDYKGKKQGRLAIKGKPNEKELAKSALRSMFGNVKGGRSSLLFGSGGLGGELKGALGNITGREIGDAAGLGGLGTRGSGPGGGGLSSDSIGLGGLKTKGYGGGYGSGYGEGAGGLGGKADRDVTISSGNPVVMGSLDKEIIRRVIKQHLAQIRYCYEKELIRSPGLFGKVATQFVISAAGTVQKASVTSATLKNAEVHRCMTAKIRTWRFPKPKGGGIVIVNYPFILKTAG